MDSNFSTLKNLFLKKDSQTSVVRGKWSLIQFAPNPSTREVFNIGVIFKENRKPFIFKVLEKADGFEAMYGPKGKDNFAFLIKILAEMLSNHSKNSIDLPSLQISSQIKITKPTLAQGRTAQFILESLYENLVPLAWYESNTRKKSIASFNSDELREKVQKEIKHQYPELADKIFNTTPITLGRGDDKYYFELDLLDCNVRLQFHQSPTSNIFGSMVSMQQKNKVYREHDLYRVTSNLLMARRYFQSQSRGYLYILFNKQYPMDDKYEIENEIDHITWGLSQIDIPHKILSSPSEVSNAILNDFQ